MKTPTVSQTLSPSSIDTDVLAAEQQIPAARFQMWWKASNRKSGSCYSDSIWMWANLGNYVALLANLWAYWAQSGC